MQTTAKSADARVLASSRSRNLKPRVLAADDQQHILEALELLLRPQGYDVETAQSPALVRERLSSGPYDAVLIDLNYTRDTTSGQEGLDLLSEIVTVDSKIPVIVMTAWGNVELAVEAMRRGARDFIQKPWENERLLTIIRTQIELHRALRAAEFLAAENQLLRAPGRPEFIATAPAMQPVLEAVTRIGPSDANVLITGEHGTGKEIVAQTLHTLSPRASRSLVTVNTGALPEGTFESELFGHVKGAFTDARSDRIGRFELADGGTIFLDEIGNVPLHQQAKLLRALESGTIERVGSSRTRRVDVRIISATNSDLRAACASGTFREDLLFRLNTVEIHLPSLRERREDIPVLAAHFLSRYASRYRRAVHQFDASALQLLTQYSWPGNVRELEHTLERAVLMCRTSEIQPSDLGLNSFRPQSQSLEELSLEGVEAVLIRKALQRFQGNISQAADALGLSRGALYRRMEKYGSSPRGKPNPGAGSGRRKRRRLRYERRVTLFTFLVALPGLLISGILIWLQPWGLESKCALFGIEFFAWWLLATALREQTTRPLQTLANVLSALREEDYSFRARGAAINDALGELSLEVNSLADELADQRIGSIETTALLRRVVEEVEVPLFAFDPDRTLRLVNPAGERLLQEPGVRVLGSTADELGLAGCLTAENGTLLPLNLNSPSARWLIRRSTFRQRGVPHTLVVLSDVSRALREEERKAWQRLIRVLGHELNNSLASIKSIAGSLSSRVAQSALNPEERQDFDRGLQIIESRAAALNRFLQAYRQLAQMPPPNLRKVVLTPIVQRVAALETRLKVETIAGPNVELMIDPDQVEQMLINLVRNAVEAALEPVHVPPSSDEKHGNGSLSSDPAVVVGWSLSEKQLTLTIEDNGPGLLNPSNAFVPFYTTKSSGSGIGLVLSRQIAEAHGGTLELLNGKGYRGCVAKVVLPQTEPASGIPSRS